MKIVDDRKKKDAEKRLYVGDVVEVKDSKGKSYYGLIAMATEYINTYYIFDLENGKNITSVNNIRFEEFIDFCRREYNIRKVNAELHIKEGE